MFQIGIGGRATLQNAIDFLLDLLIPFRMPQEQIPSPGKRGGSCFMTPQKEDQTFGHHLLITHGLTIFISGLQEDGEKIMAVSRVATPLVNKASNLTVQHLHGFFGATIAWCRPTVWQWREPCDSIRNVRRDSGHGCAKFVDFGEDIGIKEHFADNAHGQVGHMLTNVNDGTINPSSLDSLTIIAHDIGIASNTAWLEKWSHELTLVAVKIALATEDAITQYCTKGSMECHAFVKVIGMLD